MIRVHMKKFAQGQNCGRMDKIIRLYIFKESTFQCFQSSVGILKKMNQKTVEILKRMNQNK